MYRDLLKKLAHELDVRELSYMVIGGQAVLVHGEPRLTQDIDVTLGADIDRLPEVMDAIRSLGWRCLPEDPAKFVSETMVLPCEEPDQGIRIDLVFSFSPYESEAMERAQIIDYEGTPLRFITAEDLVIHKLFASRARDIEDVRSIILRNSNLNVSFIRKWLSEFEVVTEKSLVNQFDKMLVETKKS